MKADGGPAFPVSDTHHPDGQIQYGTNGMSLRDWFAGQALAGLMASPNGPRLVKEAVDASYHAADTMLRARERGQELNDDEAWFEAQAKACLHRDGDGMSWASCEVDNRIIAASGGTRAAAIRALRAKVEGGAQ